jgi:tetratricopeptide (TPR) repeat protein
MAKLTQVCKGSEAWRTNLAQGQFALMDEKLDVAIDLLRKTTELNPDIGEPQLMLGGIYLTQGKFIQAREALRKALAGIYDEKTAERAYRTLAHINDLLDGSGDGVISRDSKGYQIRGGIYLSEGDYEKAIENLTEAIRLEPKEETNYRYRALAHVYQHEYDKAMSDCNEALRRRQWQI